MSEKKVLLSLKAGPNSDTLELEELTYKLRDELKDLDLGTVDLIHDAKAPPGSKAFDLASIGSIAMTIVSSGALTQLVNGIQTWLTRHERCSVTLGSGKDKVTIKGYPSKGQQAVVNKWINAHSKMKNG